MNLLPCFHKLNPQIYSFFVTIKLEQEEMEREIRRRLQLKASNDLAIECRRRQKEKEMEEEEAWKAKMLFEMEKVTCNSIHHFFVMDRFKFLIQFYQLYPRYST